METLIIKVKNKEKLRFIYNILKYFDFVELPALKTTHSQKSEVDFFSAAGIWKDREINQEELRKKAWKRN